ncbi:cation-translocating P-type ATPase [Flavisolibacter nicotianae]|uniref:cation-translocating P-type ATPase n=1 Tax=Flavisolibacter nicotianae TaxID=2364882 RepID=UPI000EAC4D7F|nr:cation-translocating P-type ATPase [Flavisolibacter nicotianae]
MNWYSLDREEVFRKTGSSTEGLSDREAAQKLAEFGPNQLIEKKKTPAWLLFVNQFKDLMIVILVVAAVISGIVGDSADTVIILVIVFLNAIVGFVQEYRAEKAMDALKKMAAQHSLVLRNGQVHTLDAAVLVPGDVVLLEAGNTVPADLRLTEGQSLKIMEASLTGESLSIDKTVEAIPAGDLPLGDQVNMAFKNTQVTNGRGKGVVIAIGMETEIGRIASMLQEKVSPTPLQQRLNDFGKKLSYLILLICVVLFVVGLLRGEEPVRMLLVSISLAVAAIPEALPALITIALSRGAARLVKKNVLIRKLTAVETLGSVTYICTDKTGTLTENRMTVVQVNPAETEMPPPATDSMLELSMALNHTVIWQEDDWLGDPTEIAMVLAIQKKYSPALYESVQQNFERVGELPFDSIRKCMTTIHRYGDRYLVITKGAAESIVSRLQEENETPLEEAGRLASQGLRVLAFGYRLLPTLPEELTEESIEKDLAFAGLVGMIDPPREEIRTAIAECKTAGIQPVMITGDHRETAAAIAREIGLLTKGGLVVTGAELAAMDEEELASNVEKIRVYARVSPEQKLSIVKALQQKGHFVAMTGDGVNDAPSLKRANIGIAMGITGTDVTKEVADMILLDDNFATIVRAVREGRRIYDNIRRFVKYIMTCNSAEIWTIFLAPFLGLPIPLLPIHILWINLVTDGLPGLALSAEKAEEKIMERQPRKPDESLFAEGIGYHIAWMGLLMAFLTLGTQAWAIHAGDAHWQTMVFTVLTFVQLAQVFSIRSDDNFIYKKGFFSNPFLTGAILLTVVLQLAVIYLPVANRLFRTEPLSLSELSVCTGVAVVVFHVAELSKWFRKKWKNRQKK